MGYVLLGHEVSGSLALSFHRTLPAVRLAARVGFGALALVAALVVLAASPGGSISAVDDRGPSVVPDSEVASAPQETEPEGVDTTDPEASDEDGSGAPSWLAFVVIGVFTVGFLIWYLARLQRQDSGGG